jgi:hypothetical protein
MSRQDANIFDERYREHRELQLSMEGQLRTLVELTRQYVPQEVLWSGTVELDAGGLWKFETRSLARAIFVDNQSGSTLIVYAGTPGPSQPSYGVGVHQLLTGNARTYNGKTNCWTIWGTSGLLVDVQVFGGHIDPGLGGGGGGGGLGSLIGGTP